MGKSQGFEEKEVVINGINVNCKIAGSSFAKTSEGKPAILILHGWGSKSDKWVGVAEFLSQNNFSVVVPDLPGFGKSNAPRMPWGTEDYVHFVEQFVEALGLGKFYLLGHSFGGGIAAVYSARHPQKVQGLFLVASAILRRKTLKKTISKIIAKTFGLFSCIPFYELFRRAMYKYVIKSDYSHSSGLIKETYLKVISQDLYHFLKDIHTPTMIIWGSQDDVVPAGDAYVIQRAISGSKLVMVPEADHDIEQHMPEQLAKQIADFCSNTL